MPATARVDVYNGASPGTAQAWTDNWIFDRSDTLATSTSNPIVVPTSGTNYSWRRSFRLNFTVTPAGSITNLRWFTPGTAVATGVKPYAKTLAFASYAQGTSGDETGIAGMTDATTYTSAAPLTVNSGTVLSNPTTGYGTQDLVVVQMGVDTTAGPGTTSGYTMTYRYNET